MPKTHHNISYLFLRINAGILTDLSLAAGGTILCGDLEETVCIDFKGGDKFSLSPSHWGNSIELELSEQPVITALRPLALVSVKRVSRANRRR